MGAASSEPAGEPIARAWTHRQWTPLARALAAVGDRWTLLIVLQLASGPLRLSRLKERLPGISSGVLDGHVHQMTDGGLISRRRYREVPPRVEVELTRAGRELLPVARALMRWGMRHVWSAPAEREHVEVASLVSSLPILLAHAEGLPDGILELVVRRAGSVPCEGAQLIRLILAVEHGAVALRGEEHAPSEVAPKPRSKSKPQSQPRAGRIEGDEAAWQAALTPAADYAGLRLDGDVAFAVEILGRLPGREEQPS